MFIDNLSISAPINSKISYLQQARALKSSDNSDILDIKLVKKAKEAKESRLKRLNEIDKYKFSKLNRIKLLAISDDEFDELIKAIEFTKTRQNAFKTNFTDFTSSQDSFDVLNERYKSYVITFPKELGYRNVQTVKSNYENGVNTRRVVDYNEGKQHTVFVDESRLNPEYKIRNFYSELCIPGKDTKFARERKIEIKDDSNKPILNYQYLRGCKKHFNVAKIIENDREYDIKYFDNGNVDIKVGKKTFHLLLEHRLNFTNKKDKTNFVNSLKMLSPEMLFALDRNVNTIYPSATYDEGYNGGKLTVNPSNCTNCAKSITNSLIEYIARKDELLNDKYLLATYNEELTKYNTSKVLENKDEKESFLSSLLPSSKTDYSKNYVKPQLTDMSYKFANPEMVGNPVEIIKEVCDMIWFESYEEGWNHDDAKRILLNYFPQTTAYIISQFELNDAK